MRRTYSEAGPIGAPDATRAGANPPMAPALSALPAVSGGRVSTAVTIRHARPCEKWHMGKTTMKFLTCSVGFPLASSTEFATSMGGGFDSRREGTAQIAFGECGEAGRGGPVRGGDHLA